MHVTSQSFFSCYTSNVIYKKRGKGVPRVGEILVYILRTPCVA